METHPLTPKQIELLQSPQAQMIIEALDLQVVPSDEFLKSQKIQARVDSWFQEFRGYTPVYQRQTRHTPDPAMGKPENLEGGANF
jgi:hypothetical protein